MNPSPPPMTGTICLCQVQRAERTAAQVGFVMPGKLAWHIWEWLCPQVISTHPPPLYFYWLCEPCSAFICQLQLKRFQLAALNVICLVSQSINCFNVNASMNRRARYIDIPIYI